MPTALGGSPHIGSAKFDQTLSATRLTAFNQTIQNSASYPDGRTDAASAQQNSSVTATGDTLHITATGRASFSATFPQHNDNVFTDSVYSIEFTLDSSAPYTLSEQSSLQTSPGGQDGEMSYRGAALMQGQTNLLPFLQTYQTSPQTYTDTLAAGTYTFTGDLHGNGDINDHGTANFSLDFTVGQTTSPPTSAVPLPPSFWLALPVLGGLTLWFGRRRDRFA